MADVAETSNIELAGNFLEWQLIENAKDELSGRSKALFKAMKDKGFNTKAARIAFREKRVSLEATTDDITKAEEAEAEVDLYRAALDHGLASRARPAHTREGQPYAEQKGRESTTPKSSNSNASSAETVDLGTTPHDPETGEITEHEQPETANQSAADSRVRDAFGVQGKTEPQTSAPAESVSDGISATHSNPPAPNSQALADKTEAVSSRSVSVALSDDDVPAFLKKDKDGCLKLKDGHCRIGFVTDALCSECNHARMARAG